MSYSTQNESMEHGRGREGAEPPSSEKWRVGGLELERDGMEGNQLTYI